MSVPRVTAVQLGGGPDLPLLVCGPSLGTSATALWSATAARLAHTFHVVAWDLPGHGRNTLVEPQEPFDLAELAAGVLQLVDRVQLERGDPGTSFAYAGDSVGGAVGLQLLLDTPERVRAAALLCTGAKIGEESGWRERAATVRASGTPIMVDSSARRWFSPGFLDREPSVGAELLRALQEAHRSGYAAVCEALATFDVRDRLGQISAPVLAVAGHDDQAAPIAGMRLVADTVQNGRLVVLDNVAHLAPAEAPAEVAQLLREHLRCGDPAYLCEGDPVGDAGTAVRRQVLGDTHVDRALARTTDFTRDFQDFITRYAWGSIWTRPGLDRRSRSMITLTALLARGHHEELAMHVRAARRNGLTNEEIKEVFLNAAIYCGVPDANNAFRIAQPILDEIDAGAEGSGPERT
ncbi:MAG TPA: 4-carboxymuconolactone decarboxylase [Segeticoccus sp.]|uniref:bifunctional 3-oxoadipate enol-lactonase/4-carboxymuconolactone decarboxylase PcaDC n=1 Tax=Segeticoccus sp. TaxID=2706531 RepID=UPI002D80BBA0|nr:4-carboxymuconolactone decarboxylase [Segeticoccus sp.]HET8601823.1 4-carboxymuconolactone decarboxylase [Segeticoccus sp.]